MRFLQALLLCLSLLPLPASAQVVVELFTSQGCSSCPPADRLLGDLAKRDDVLALAYHVDYWDYLGWKDTFAKPEFTRRQRDYARSVDRQYIGRRLRGSFTPEVVIGGYDSLVGSSRQGIVSRIVAHRDMAEKAQVAMRREGGKLVITMRPVGAGAGPADVMLATVLPEATVDIERGENRGKTITYHRIVTGLDVVGRWDGAAPASVTVTAPEGALVAFLQQGRGGRIVAAGELR